MRMNQLLAGAIALIAGVGGAVGLATVSAEGTKPAVITIHGDPSVSESARQYVLTIQGSNVVQPITIEGRASGGTASPNTDYKATGQTLTINGTAFEPQTLTIMGIVDDEVREPDETVNIDLRSTDGSFADTRTVTIQDDDGALDGLLCPVVPGVVNVVGPLLNRVSHDIAMNSIRNCK